MLILRINLGVLYLIITKIMNMNNNVNGEKELMVEDFHQRLLIGYGYDSNQIDCNVMIQPNFRVDIAIWRTVNAKNEGKMPDVCVVVVCRAEHIRIHSEEYLGDYQSTGLNASVFFVAHNMKETRVFYLDESHPGSVERFADFPKAQDVLTDVSLDTFVSKMRNCTKDSLLQAFSKCHNIIRNNDKLSPEAAFDEISKVMFIKMLYERKPDDELIFSKDKFERDERAWLKKNKGESYITYLFDKVKSQYQDDNLFDSIDMLRITRTSFLLILKALEVIDLYSMAEDVKGVAFESFLGKTFRGELGQFFTPRTIVNYMVDVLDVKEGELVCDPCCGSGGFLIRAFEKVQDDIDRDIHKQIKEIVAGNQTTEVKATSIKRLVAEFDKARVGSRYYKLCNEYFYGVDANVRMARTSKMNMIMHGDGHVGVYLHDGLFDVGGVCEGKFDVILINPPFGVHLDRTIKVKDKKSISDFFELNSNNAEYLFIERCIRLLKPGGRAGLVLPEGVFNNNSAKKVRDYVERHAHILNITSIPADVFLASGANVKPSLLFIRKYTVSEFKSKVKKRSICASKVEDAGINSLGLPSDNAQLLSLAPIIQDWINKGNEPTNEMVRMISCEDMDDWNVQPFFNTTPIKFKESLHEVRLFDVMSIASNWILLDDNTQYKRLTVKLFNKGITVRDVVLGKDVGTKKQQIVRTGQFVVSKIDGKSGAFAFLPSELDGAIVTQDFPVFDIDTSLVMPEYLELVLSNQSMLEYIKSTCSGSTGRKRLSISKFLNIRIPLPLIEEQKKYVDKIIELRRQRAMLDQQLIEEIHSFNNSIFE